MGVQIISMSWTIEKITDKKASKDLQKAIDAAVSSNILLFCASDDQGNTKTENPYPARCNKDKIFRIGAATSWGNQGPTVRPESVDYIFPGDITLIPDWQRPIPASEPGTASSLATALASGLAALILHCAALRSEKHFNDLRGHEKMKAAFGNISSHNNYLHVWKVFEEYLKKNDMEDDRGCKDKGEKIIDQVLQHLLRT